MEVTVPHTATPTIITTICLSVVSLKVGGARSCKLFLHPVSDDISDDISGHLTKQTND